MGILDLNRPEVSKALGELERLSLLADGSEAQVCQGNNCLRNMGKADKGPDNIVAHRSSSFCFFS